MSHGHAPFVIPALLWSGQRSLPRNAAIGAAFHEVIDQVFVEARRIRRQRPPSTGSR